MDDHNPTWDETFEFPKDAAKQEDGRHNDAISNPKPKPEPEPKPNPN